MKRLKLALLAIAALTAGLTHAQAQITNYFPSISSGSTVCTGCTSGNLIGSSGGAIVDSGVAIANVPRLNAANSFTATQSITTSGLNYAINTSQAASGTATAPCVVGATPQVPCLNLINITSENVDAASFIDLDYLQIHATIGGSLVTGARQMLDVTGDFTSPTSASNTNRFYVAGVFQMNVLSGDGGTSMTPLGSFFGENIVVRSGPGATFVGSFNGMEIDINLAAGTDPLDRIGVSSVAFCCARGTVNDASYSVGSVGGVGAKPWITALNLTNGNAGPPLDSTNGCVICTSGEPETIKTFADLSNYTITGNILNFNAFQVSGAGVIVASNEVIAPATGLAAIQIDPLTAGNNSYVEFDDAATAEYRIGKLTTNNFFAFNVSTGGIFISDTTAGVSSFGDAGATSIVSNGNTGLTVATTGQVNVSGILNPATSFTPTAGSGAASVAGNDQRFVITAGTAQTSITANFGHTWTAAPVCSISSNSTASVVDIASTSTTAITLGASVALTGSKINILCFGA